MKLLQELKTMHEGQVKDAIMDIIDKAITRVDTSGMSYDQAVRKIAQKAHELDVQEILSGMPASELIAMVKAQFEPEDMEAVREEAENGNTTIIAKADEFTVQLDGDDEMVHLLDGEKNIRVSMPLVIWKQLCRQ